MIIAHLDKDSFKRILDVLMFPLNGPISGSMIGRGEPNLHSKVLQDILKQIRDEPQNFDIESLVK